MIENLRPLTQEQRQGAHKSAREAVICAIGPKATRAFQPLNHLNVSCCGYLIRPSLNERRIVWDEISSHHRHHA